MTGIASRPGCLERDLEGSTKSDPLPHSPNTAYPERIANLSRNEAKVRLLAGAAVYGDVDTARLKLSISTAHLEALRAEDPNWSERLDLVAAFDPATATQEPFAEFRLRCFGFHSPPHHLRIQRAHEAAEPGSVTLILAFPQAGKTTLKVDRICWKLAYDPDWRFAVVSEGQDLARKIVGQVASRMTDEMVAPEYLHSFGPFQSPDRSKPWNADFLSVLRSHRDQKEPSLEARGAGSTFYGGRYDDIDGDDIQSDRNIGDTNKLVRYIRQTVLTRPDDDRGKVTFDGSRVDAGDVYRRMVDEEMVDHLVTIPALTQPVAAEEHYTRRRVDGQWVVEVNPDCPARPTWPERTSLLQLAVRRQKVGEEIWARTYMQQQVATGGAVFAESEVEACLDHGRGLGRNGLGVDCIMTIDPATDTGIAAFQMLAYSSSKLWCIDAIERTDCHRYEDTYDQVGTWAMRYRPSVVIVERNNFQKGLARDDRMLALADKFGFELWPHNTDRSKNDPVIGVKMMASAFVDQEISIPWGDEDARNAFRPLVDELGIWRPKTKVKQNMVMATWFAWLWWEQVRQSMDRIEVVRFARPSWLNRAG